MNDASDDGLHQLLRKSNIWKFPLQAPLLFISFSTALFKSGADRKSIRPKNEVLMEKEKKKKKKKRPF